MTFDPTSVEVTCVTPPKDHCVQVPWEYINVYGYSDQFCKTLTKITTYEGHSVNSEIRCVSAIVYLLAESWCCLYKAPTFISYNTKETIS